MLISIIIFFFGLLIGSFLNVCIYRLPRKESLLFPWSHCPECNTQIKPYDNIPILSYLLLAGKCRECHWKIPVRYPVVEFITALVYSILYLHYGVSLEFLLNTIFVSSLIVIAFIDLEHSLILNVVTLPLIIFFILAALIKYLVFKDVNLIIYPLAGLFTGGGIIYLIALISGGGMGGGDIKLASLIGAALGLEKLVLTLFLSFLTGGITGIILILTGKKTRKDRIPFGPFLCIASIVSLLKGNEIIDWYFYLARI